METYFEELTLRRDIAYNKYVMTVIFLSILFIYLNFNYIKFNALNVTVIIYNVYIIFLRMIKISISIKDNVLLIRLIWPFKLKSSFTLLLNEIVETKIFKEKKMIMHPYMHRLSCECNKGIIFTTNGFIKIQSKNGVICVGSNNLDLLNEKLKLS